MAEELLVGEQLTPEMIRSGEAVVAALDRSDVSVSGAFWMLTFGGEQKTWRFFVASPDVRESGPKALYRRIRAALGSLPNDVQPIATKDISAIDTKARPFVLLRKTITTPRTAISGVRVFRHVIDGEILEDAYLYRMA